MFEPEQLEFPFETSAEVPAGKNPDSANLACPILALNEQLLSTYLSDLRNGNPARRRKAARGLANLGDIARRAIPALREVLADRDRKVREAAAFALKQLDAEEAA